MLHQAEQEFKVEEPVMLTLVIVAEQRAASISLLQIGTLSLHQNSGRAQDQYVRIEYSVIHREPGLKKLIFNK